MLAGRDKRMSSYSTSRVVACVCLVVLVNTVSSAVECVTGELAVCMYIQSCLYNKQPILMTPQCSGEESWCGVCRGLWLCSVKLLL